MNKLFLTLGLLGIFSGSGAGQESRATFSRNDLLRGFDGTIIKQMKTGRFCYRVEPHHLYLQDWSKKEIYWEIIESPDGLCYVDTDGDRKIDMIGGLDFGNGKRNIKREFLEERDAAEFDRGFKAIYNSLCVDNFLHYRSSESRPKD